MYKRHRTAETPWPPRTIAGDSRPLRRFYLALGIVLVCVTTGATEIHYIDLHQAGSSAIILQGTGEHRKVLLVDAGKYSATSGRGGARVLEKLNDLKITHIDVAIFSHIDQDHFGGYRNLLGLVPPHEIGATTEGAPRGPPITIGAIIEPGMPLPKQSYGTFIEDVKAAGITHLRYNHAQDRAQIRALQRTLDFVLYAPREPKTANESSLLVRIDDAAKGTSDVLTGDTTREAWATLSERFPQRPVTTITAPHHGGDAVLQAIIAKTTPARIVVQADAENQYRHPKLRVLRDVARYGHTVDLRYVESLSDLLAEERVAVIEYLSLTRLRGAGTVQQKLDERARDFAERVAQAQQQVRETTMPFLYRDILLTSERGDITIKDATVTTQRPGATFMDEAIWYRARYLSDAEIERLKTWEEARAYLRLQVADDLRTLHEFLSPSKAAAEAAAFFRLLAGPRRGPAWIAEYERILLRTDSRLDETIVRATLRNRIAGLLSTLPRPPTRNTRPAVVLNRETRARDEAARSARVATTRAVLDDIDRDISMQVFRRMNWEARRPRRGRPPDMHYPDLDLTSIPALRILNREAPGAGVTSAIRERLQRPHVWHPGAFSAATGFGERVEREAARPRWKIRPRARGR